MFPASLSHQPYTHAVLASCAASVVPGLIRIAADAVQGVVPLAVQYSPQTVLDPAEHEAKLRHVFLAGFKPGAPVDALIAGYAGLPKTVLEMRGFEWGKIISADGAAASEYHYAFMTTFADVTARDR